MLGMYIQTDEREREHLFPVLVLAVNTTQRSSAELNPVEVMISENSLIAADVDAVGSLTPTLTASTSKKFRQLCHRTRGSHYESYVAAKDVRRYAPAGGYII